MPFTPFHFGPHATVALSIQRYIDLPVFIGANIIVDVEPLLVMSLDLNYPLHGYAHTFLIGGLLGLAWGAIAYPMKSFTGRIMAALRLPYLPSFAKMALSGVLGVWLHIVFDAPLYYEMKPFFPVSGNPLFGLLEMDTMYELCLLLFISALVMYYWLTRRTVKLLESDGKSRED